MSEIEPEIHDEPPNEMKKAAEISYQDAVRNLMFNKRQQWMVTNYVVVSYAAIYALGLKAENNCTKVLLSGLILVACVYHLFALVNIQQLMTRLRLRLSYIYADFFSPKQRERLQLSKDKKGFWHEPGILIGLMAVSAIGAAIVLASIWGTGFR